MSDVFQKLSWAEPALGVDNRPWRKYRSIYLFTFLAFLPLDRKCHASWSVDGGTE